jgi:prepilin-type N-terminal cleavage/methylation domain-containing protein
LTVHPSRRAFSLVELLIVIAVLAVAASLVIAHVGGAREEAETTVTRAVLHAMREAVLGTPEAPGYLDDMRGVPGFDRAAMRVHDVLDPSAYPAYAVYDPDAGRGWRGPYLRGGPPVQGANGSDGNHFPDADERRWRRDRTFAERGFYRPDGESDYARRGDRAVGDAWGNPIVLQVPPAEAFAAGADGEQRFRFARLVSAGPNGVLETPLADRMAGRRADGACPDRGDDLVLFLNRTDRYEDE